MAVVSIFGPVLLVSMFVGDEVEDTLESWRTGIIKAQLETREEVIKAQKAVQKAVAQAQEAANAATALTTKSVNEANDAVQKAVAQAQEAADAATALTTKSVNEANDAVLNAVSEAELATDIAKDKARDAEAAAEMALAELDRLRDNMAQTTGRLLEERGGISSLALTEGDKEAIVVRQIPRKTGEKTERGIDWVELVFKLEIAASNTDHSSKEILNQVAKVEYHFNERWFKPPVRTAINPGNEFEYSMRVWGVTMVKAVVHISLPAEKGFNLERRTEKIVFEGLMNLREEGTLRRVNG